MSRRVQARARETAAIERTAAREVASVIKATGAEIASQIASGSPWASVLARADTRMASVLEAALKRGAVAGASDVLKTIKKPERKAAPQPGYVDAFVLSWIRRHSVRRVQQVSKTTAKAIRRQIIDGAKRGWSNDRIAKAIRDATAGQIGKVRAARIARTETHTAFERGSYEQARDLKRLGLDIVSEWGATEDDRTRPDHAAADGQVVDLGKTFTVGNEAMRFPGDPRASARQVVNCRCTALYYPKGTR
jgi:uncharacterized protein with gpF-like domain